MILQYLECSWQFYWKLITILHQGYFICQYRLCIKIGYRSSWKIASSKEQICGSSFGTVPFYGQLLECFQSFLPRYIFTPHCIGFLCYHCYQLCFSLFTFFFLDVKFNCNKPLSHCLAEQGFFNRIARYQQISAALRESGVLYDVGEVQKSFLKRDFLYFTKDL